MGKRRKGLFSIGISSKVTFTVIGVFLILMAVIFVLSFVQIIFADPSESPKILGLIYSYLMTMFGPVAFGSPFLLLLLAAHMFNSKKHTLVYKHTTLGTVFILTSWMGFFASGQVGSDIKTTLIDYFGNFGAGLTLFAVFFAGTMLFFDIEPHVVVGFVKSFIKNLQVKESKNAKSKLGDEDFITDDAVKPKKHKEVLSPTELLNASSQTSTPPSDKYIEDTKKHKAPPQTQKTTMHVNPVSQTQDAMWIYPGLELLNDATSPADRGNTAENAQIIENTLRSFGIKARVAEVNPGPTVTQYAMEVAVGTNISEIVKKSSNLALALASSTGTVRIEAPIPGRSLVGIEIPNKKAELVTLRRLLNAKVFKDAADPLLVPLGLDVAGETQAISLSKLPHALIAGTTGSGKSVAINAWITTLLCRAKPSEVRLVLVDPKQVELTGYNGVPHLLTEVITDPNKVVNALRWAVAEMEARYKSLREVGVRNIQGFNELPNIEKKPYIIFVIDELADLMMVAKADIEGLIVRIAQKARAVGIHLVLATQRPSVNVITGLMKANIPTRLAFNVASGVDSKVILDSTGAETLVGKGDMFYTAPDTARPRRIQGPFVSEGEVNAIVGFIKQNNPLVQYTEEVTEVKQENQSVGGIDLPPSANGDRDPLFAQALELIRGLDRASASLFQRRMKVGYARAARILDELEEAGMVGPTDGAKGRVVLLSANSTQDQNSNPQTLSDSLNEEL